MLLTMWCYVSLKENRVQSFCQRCKHIQWRTIQPSSPTQFLITFLLLDANFPVRAIYISLIHLLLISYHFPHPTFFFPQADQLFYRSTTSIMIPTITWWASYTIASARKGKITWYMYIYIHMTSSISFIWNIYTNIHHLWENFSKACTFHLLLQISGNDDAAC